MRYVTAATYENWERIGEPYYNEKSKLVTKVKETCPRCSGVGLIISHVHNGQMVPVPVDGGICYCCGGAKYIQKEVRLYTESERAKLDAAAERARDKKNAEREARMQAEFAANKEKWLKENGFNLDGYTYIIKGDSYSIKEDLKKAGFRFNKELLWHAEQPYGFEDRVVKVLVDDVLEFTAWGKGMFKESTINYVKSLVTVPAEPSNSDYVGEIKERLRNIPVTCTKMYSFDGYYGTTTVYTFEDENENVFTWFTSSYQEIEVGDQVLLTGTVKDHKEYRGVRQTVLTRCKLTFID